MDPWMYVPAAPLSHFVAFFWYAESRTTAWRRERLLPTGTVELVVRLSDPDAAPVLCGQHTQPFFLESPGSTSVIAAHFRPGGFFPFLKIPPDEIKNQVLSLEDLWGATAWDLRDQIHGAPTLNAKYKVLEAALLAQAFPHLERRAEVAYALHELKRPNRTVASVTGQIGYSSRRFIDLFKEEVGLTPKGYARVNRFQTVIARTALEQTVDWGQIALDAGYFDQAHFANDFRSFAGLTPSEYLALRTGHLNHVPD